MAKPRAGRPSSSESRDTRKDLLNAACELFSEHGFSKVSLNDIAEKAQVSVGLIRHYFGSKDGLKQQSTRIVIKRLGTLFKRMLDGTGPSDGPAFIDHLQRRTYEELIDNLHLLRYLRHLTIEDSASANEAFVEYFQLLQQELNRLEAIGHLRPDINKVWLTFTLMYLQMGPVFLSEQIEAIIGTPSHEHESIQARQHTYSKLLKYGILAQPPGTAE